MMSKREAWLVVTICCWGLVALTIAWLYLSSPRAYWELEIKPILLNYAEKERDIPALRQHVSHFLRMLESGEAAVTWKDKAAEDDGSPISSQASVRGRGTVLVVINVPVLKGVQRNLPQDAFADFVAVQFARAWIHQRLADENPLWFVMDIDDHRAEVVGTLILEIMRPMLVHNRIPERDKAELLYLSQRLETAGNDPTGPVWKISYRIYLISKGALKGPNR